MENSDDTFIEVTPEEYDEIKAMLIARLKAIPQWYEKLADCHIKCSDIYPSLRVALWMNLTDDEIAALYEEAEHERTR